MNNAEKIFHIIAITLLSFLLALLLLYFVFLPLYHKDKATIYYEYRVKESWNGTYNNENPSPQGTCLQECFGGKGEIKCTEYDEKYEMCEMECRGTLCGECSPKGFLNELRCFQLYSK